LFERAVLKVLVELNLFLKRASSPMLMLTHIVDSQAAPAKEGTVNPPASTAPPQTPYIIPNAAKDQLAMLSHFQAADAGILFSQSFW
jgi:hypothetical protein